jgi:hypothetical protein
MDLKAILQMKACSPYHFAYFRIVLGVYLLIHFLMLIPFAPEMFSSSGLMPDASINLTHGFFPNILKTWDSPLFTQLFIALLSLLAMMFAAGIFRPVVAILLWYGWVCLFDRNNFISNPGLPFIGWILLACTIIPAGEPLRLFKTYKGGWEFPPLLFKGAWVIMSASYTLSGIDKMMSPSWMDGNAIIFLLDNPLARDWALREFFLSFPIWLLHVMTWGILSMEVLFLPLALFRRTRVIAWTGMVMMHLGILLIVDFADLTMGMLMIHLLTFDERWLNIRILRKPQAAGSYE